MGGYLALPAIVEWFFPEGLYTIAMIGVFAVGAFAIKFPVSIAMALSLIHILDKYGTMSFADVATPAIRIAEEGWVVEPNQAKWYAEMSLPLVDYYKTEDLPFFNDDLPYQTGEHIVRNDLAKTYKLLARCV